MQFDLIAHLSLPSFLSSRHQLKQALKKMEVSQTTFVGPPTPEGARENVTLAILPDLFVTFISPEPKVNPHYEQVKKESEESMRKTLWKNLSEQEVGKRCAADFCFFSAIMCPDVDKEKFRTVCDWIYWVFEFDDQFDEGELGKDQQKGKAEVARMVSVFGGEGEYKSLSRRPRPMARHFPSFLADNASKKFGAAVSSATASGIASRAAVEERATSIEDATPLQQVFRSIWERVKQVCAPAQYVLPCVATITHAGTVIASG
ncbi:Terpenoid synthase [Macrophomina phaseolina MS6]|uniref:Terpenoid synthase n=1 Tax=Macrophomina phaseolina (strain MS6) TaxID=1126212 RepID=K2RGG0_MACPH|nr:Terpenoid synthase [Macrophomina phaseolina MS6]